MNGNRWSILKHLKRNESHDRSQNRMNDDNDSPLDFTTSSRSPSSSPSLSSSNLSDDVRKTQLHNTSCEENDLKQSPEKAVKQSPEKDKQCQQLSTDMNHNVVFSTDKNHNVASSSDENQNVPNHQDVLKHFQQMAYNQVRLIYNNKMFLVLNFIINCCLY